MNLLQFASKVSIVSIKDLARKMPANHPLRAAIMAEDDELTPEEYLFKLKVWLRLLEGPVDLQ